MRSTCITPAAGRRANRTLWAGTFSRKARLIKDVYTTTYFQRCALIRNLVQFALLDFFVDKILKDGIVWDTQAFFF